MNNPFKAISISLLPNFGWREFFISLKWLVTPWKWTGYKKEKILKEKLSQYLKRKEVFLFDSGRSALKILLEALEVNENSEIVIQGLTCSVVPGAIKSVGGVPVYVDIDKNYNMDVKKLSEVVSKNTKAVIVQNSFGTPANLGKIRDICKKNKLVLIEDGAHGLGAEYEGKKLGGWSEVSFLSFGRDKVISGVWGGAITTDDEKLARKIEKLSSKLSRVEVSWVGKQLVYVILTQKIVTFYNLFGLGKFVHKILGQLKWLSEPISKEEKRGGSREAKTGIVDPLTDMLIGQLGRLDQMVFHRRMLAKFYSDELGGEFYPSSSYLRYPIEVEDPIGLKKAAADKNIFLGDWYDQVVAPKSVDPEKFGYNRGSCMEAEKVAAKIVNLPTNPNISLKDAAKVVAVVKKWKLRQ